MKFVLTGGGTGGHLAIAKALLDAITAAGDEAIFIGSTTGQDRMWFGEGSAFVQTHFLGTTGVVNRRGAAKLAALWRVARAGAEARRILKGYRPDAVISVGGFSAAPASFAALALGIPFFIHEQNAVTGRLNRLLRRYARRFFSSYDPGSPVRSYPVNRALFETARERDSVQTVIFLGGSQGAKAINDFALAVAPELARRGIAVIHQCGERDYERVRSAYAQSGIEAELYGFTKELPALLARSDLAVSRAGASTLWELAANGLPALYVPYPYAAGDHQYYNAVFLAEQGLSWVVREEALRPEMLAEILDEGVAAASRGLRMLEREDAAARIMDAVREAC
ncbi:undecaprenyldiphospho-muramoylpentapeptide beta-N-acetylglucosaminyltransferase [Sulfurimonas sp. HSL1-2]|uniref:undecaprenyldiphospho-muramoylpentapeptide beta-N-acetylglucosaminyltransferase n=1 Tax=Thiomicrolovo zhangzhouensis TaxID=3131933 RepID=UPI0031F83B70